MNHKQYMRFMHGEGDKMEKEQTQRKDYEDICKSLQNEIIANTNIEIRLKGAYRDGYIQGCEDFFKKLRRE